MNFAWIASYKLNKIKTEKHCPCKSLQYYQKNLIDFRYLRNLYEDRYSDADFTAKKPMDFDGFLKGEPFKNSNQSYRKIYTWALLASGQGVIKLI